MNRELQRVLIDNYNASGSNILAQAHYKSSFPIVEFGDQYNIVVESAEVDLTKMPLDISPNFKIVIDVLDKNIVFDHSDIVNSLNLFNFGSNPLLSTSDLFKFINDTLTKRISPFQLGTFGINVDNTELIQYNFTQQQETDSQYFDVYFNQDLYKIFSEFCDTSATEFYDEMYYKLVFPTIPGGELKVVKVQTYPSLNGLLKAKSLRFYTDLPLQKYLVYNETDEAFRVENILTTIIINSENYDIEHQKNLILVPNVFKDIQIASNAPIDEFKVWIKIYYKNTKSIHHVLAPGEYFNISLLFKKKQ